MWDMRCEIMDFALCPEPWALRLLTPDTQKFGALNLGFQNAE